jgi:peroxiredoxin (alkyl hydroperoxide reductase subunit C)
MSVTSGGGRTSLADSTKTLKAGDPAPDFELKTHAGETWRLSDRKGKSNVLLAFYPFAFSPTCSRQMPAVEEHLDKFAALGAEVVGISVDSTHANRAWAESNGGFSYALLSDFYPHGDVAERYGVLRPEGMSERAVFIIDKAGIVRYIDVHKISEYPDEEQLFEELRKLG